MGGNRAPAVLKDLRTWIAAAIVAPSAVTIFSSLIFNNAVNAINTRVFPPHANIQGMLTSKQLAVKQLRVELDGGAFTFSAADGSFGVGMAGVTCRLVDQMEKDPTEIPALAKSTWIGQ